LSKRLGADLDRLETGGALGVTPSGVVLVDVDDRAEQDRVTGAHTPIVTALRKLDRPVKFSITIFRWLITGLNPSATSDNASTMLRPPPMRAPRELSPSPPAWASRSWSRARPVPVRRSWPSPSPRSPAPV